MDQAEIPAMTELHDTYGKTIHTCQSQFPFRVFISSFMLTPDGLAGITGEYDTSPDFPMGPPKLMMSYVNDEQVPQDLVKERDE